MSYAEIKSVNDQPTIVIAGKPYSSMTMTNRICKPEYLKAFGECGIKIYFLMANTDGLRHGRN